MRRLSTLIAVLMFGTNTAAHSEQHKSDSQLLDEVVLPGLKIAREPKIQKIFGPYLRCYAEAVETSSSAALDSDAAVLTAEKGAQERCEGTKNTATKAAVAFLSTRSDLAPPNVDPVALLRHVRRQMSIFALWSSYRLKQREGVITAYFERIGREAQNGRQAAMLSGE